MIWDSNKWKRRADVVDAATAAYLERLRNEKVVQIVFKLTSDTSKDENSVVSDGICAVESLRGMKEEGNYNKSSLQMGGLRRIKEDLMMKAEVCKEGTYEKSTLEMDSNSNILKQETVAKGSHKEMYSNVFLLKQDTVAKGNQKAKLMQPPWLSYKKRKVKCRSHRFYLSYKEAVVCQGVFSVPMSAVTGDQKIDSRNLELVALYSKISEMLQNQSDEMLPGLLKCANGSLKKVVASLRSEGLSLRRQIIELGGVPIAEPLRYWRFKYQIVSF